jgi:hypothetical protein
MSAYLLFCEDMRPKIKEIKPDINPKDMSLELGKLWKEIGDDEKLVGGHCAFDRLT